MIDVLVAFLVIAILLAAATSGMRNGQDPQARAARTHLGDTQLVALFSLNNATDGTTIEFLDAVADAADIQKGSSALKTGSILNWLLNVAGSSTMGLCCSPRFWHRNSAAHRRSTTCRNTPR